MFAATDFCNISCSLKNKLRSFRPRRRSPKSLPRRSRRRGTKWPSTTSESPASADRAGRAGIKGADAAGSAPRPTCASTLIRACTDSRDRGSCARGEKPPPVRYGKKNVPFPLFKRMQISRIQILDRSSFSFYAKW